MAGMSLAPAYQSPVNLGGPTQKQQFSQLVSQGGNGIYLGGDLTPQEQEDKRIAGVKQTQQEGLDYTSQSLDNEMKRAQVQGATGGGGSRSSASSGGAGNPALSGLLSALQSQTPYQPAQVAHTVAPSAASSTASDYAGAKERGALATKAAMKGLSGSLAARGVGTETGVGADAIASLYKTGLTNLADTDRQFADTDAARQFSADQSQVQTTEGENTFNANAQNAASQYNNDSRLRQLQLLASLY